MFPSMAPGQLGKFHFSSNCFAICNRSCSDEGTSLLNKKGPAFGYRFTHFRHNIRYCRSADPKLKMKGSKTLTSSQKSEP